MSTIDPTPTPPPLPATTTTSISPAQSAALRLTTLEYLLHGHPSSSSLPSSSSNSAVLPRLSSAITQLSTLKQTCGKSLTRLIDEWETYSPLLHPLEPSQKEEVWDAKEQSSYLLTQYEDLTATLKDLTKIETLLEQAKVLDGDLNKGLARATAANQQERLRALQNKTEIEKQRSAAVQERVLQLVHDWSHYTSTLSQAFTLLDSELLQLERQVSSLERARSDSN